MPRGQDAPTVRGGQIDPYLQESLSQGRAESGNRLVTAMQEAGAAQRQKSAQTSTMAQQGQQQQFEMQQQAAELEAQDRRAAENIAAQREQNELTKVLEESRQRFEAKENQKRLDYERERETGNDKIAEQRHLEMMAEVRASRDLGLAQTAMEDNRNFSILTSMQNKETAMEAAVTAANQAADEGEQLTNIYQKTLARQTGTAMIDFKNLSIEEKEKTVPVTSYEGVVLFPESQFKEGNYTGPGTVLQRLIADNGSSISIGDLTSASISNLQGQIREGKTDAEDVRGAITALDASLPAIDKRIEETSGRAQILWKAFRNRVEDMQGNLESLRNKKDKVVGQQVETVGSTIRRALGVKYPEMAFSTRMLDLRNRTGQINREAIQNLTRGIEPWESLLLPIDPKTMNEYDIATREAHNAGLTNARQKISNGVSSPTWGAE